MLRTISAVSYTHLHCMQALALIRIGCRNIRKGRMPSARGAVAERRHQERLLLLSLIHILVVTALGMKRSEKTLGYAASTANASELTVAKSGSLMLSLIHICEEFNCFIK